MNSVLIIPKTRTAGRSSYRVAILCACCLVCLPFVAGGLRAQDDAQGADSAPPVLDDSFFQGRRTELMNRVREGLIILRSAETPATFEQYTQNNSFYYLTGIESPDLILVIIPQARETHLFGRKPAGGSGDIKEVHKYDEFQSVMAQLVRKTREVRIPLQPEEIGCMNLDGASMSEQRRKEDPWDGRDGREGAFKRVLEKKFKGIKVADLSPVLYEMRRVKSDQEIRMIEEACRITCESLADATGKLRAGMPEYEIAAYIQFGFTKRGAQGVSFHHIVAGGANALNFHHLAGRPKLKEGELVVIDVGATYGYYASDVTRTVPVGGKFSEEQRKLYEALLKAQEAAIAEVKPGATMGGIHKKALQSLREAGLDSYVGHSTCHYVGMAAHDPGSDSKELEPGVVVTVEPGIYLREKGIGIRIEDTVVVTENGCRVLSAGMPKSVDEIEKLMGGGD